MKFPKFFLLIFFVFLFSFTASATSSKNFFLYTGSSTEFEGHNIYILQGLNPGNLMVKIDDKVLFLNYFRGSSDELYTEKKDLEEKGIYDDLITGAHEDYVKEFLCVGNDCFIQFHSVNHLHYFLRVHDFSVSYCSGPSVSYNDVVLRLNSICYSVSENNCARIVEGGFGIEPAFYFTAEKRKPNIEVRTTYDKRRVWPGETIEVTTTIKNTGDVRLRNFEYWKQYPSEVFINPTSALTNVNNEIRFTEFQINPGRETSFRYRIHLTEPLAYSLKGNYKYTYDGNEFQGETANVDIDLKKVIDVSLSVSRTNPLDGESELTIEIKNLVDDKVDYNLWLNIPDQIVSKAEREFKVSGNTFSLNGKLDKLETITRKIELKFPYIGDFQINGRYDYKYIIENPPVYFQEDIRVIENFDDFTITNYLRYKKILSGDNTTLQVHVVRRDDEIDFSNLRLSVKGDGLNIKKTGNHDLSPFKKGETFRNFNFLIESPKVNCTTDFNIYVNLTADVLKERIDSYTKTVIQRSDLRVHNYNDIVSIRRDVNPNPAEQNTTFMTSLSVVNNLDNRFFNSFYVKETPPEDYIFRPVKTDGYFSIRPEEILQLFSYQLKAPFLINENTSTSKTFFDFGFVSFTLSDDLSPFIKIKETSIDVDLEFEQEKILTGDRSRLKLTISNKGDLDAYNILTEFPVFENTDLMLGENQNRDVRIDFLQPGESVTFYRDYLAKIPKNDSSTTSYSSRDVYGNIFYDYSLELDSNIEEGLNSCFVEVFKKINTTIENNTYVGKEIPFILNIYNRCSQEVEINLHDPEISFNLQGNIGTSYFFRKSFSGNFTGAPGVVYDYTYGFEKRVSRSNNVEEEFIVVTQEEIRETQTSSSSSQSGSIGETGKEHTSPLVLEVDYGELTRNFITIFVVIFVIFVLINVLIKYAKKKNYEKSSSEEFMADGSLQAPDVGKGISYLDNYIKKSRISGVPEIEIEQNLLKKGWDKNVLDAFMGDKN